MQELAEIDIHSDREKEHAEQETLERLNHGLDCFSVLRFRQHQSGDESAKGHRQIRLVGDEASGNDDEQSRGDKQFGGMRAGDQTK